MSKTIGITPGPVQFESLETSDVKEFKPANSGSTGQVLTKTSNGYKWQTPSGGDGAQFWTHTGYVQGDIPTQLSPESDNSAVGVTMQINIPFKFGANNETYEFRTVAVRDVSNQNLYTCSVPVLLQDTDHTHFFQGMMYVNIVFDYNVDKGSTYSVAYNFSGFTDLTPAQINEGIKFANMTFKMKYMLDYTHDDSSVN